MSDADQAHFPDFGKLVPGFDFLKNLSAQSAASAAPAMPGMAQRGGWVAPTLNVEELDKRIAELKAVQFWLDQNTKALSATIQALEVQRMTLSTLQSMNVGMADVAAAMSGKAAGTSAAPDKDKTTAPTVDPMQWWGALTEQFQHIATHAMKDMATHASTHATNAVPKNFPAKKTTASNKSSSTAGSAKRKAPSKTSTTKPKASR